MKYSSTEICKLANVTKKTLRHYYKIALLSPSTIDDNGYWYYSDQELETIQLIKNLQVIGYSLKEIKEYLENDFQGLRSSIPDKLRYIDEQIIQLNLAKRLLRKLEVKKDLDPYDAVNESMDEEHIEWYQKNLQPDQYKLVKDLMADPKSMVIHEKLVNYLYKLKPFIQQRKLEDINKTLDQLRALFINPNFEKKTVDKLIESFLKSNLEGPLSRRILTVSEVVYLLQLL